MKKIQTLVIGSAIAVMSVPSLATSAMTTVRPTADDQPMSERDVNIVSEIRREIMKNDNLSTRAKNVKIVAEGNTLSLQGDVESLSEKNTIEQIARRIAKPSVIQNDLVIRSN